MKPICKHSAFFILFLVFCSAVHASQSDSATKQKLSVYALKYTLNMESGSGGLNQSIVNTLAFGGFITKSTIQKAEDLLRAQNRAGYLFSTAITVLFDSTNRKTKKPGLYKISYGYQFLQGAGFSLGAFQAVFRGNADFKGKQLDVNLRLQQIATQNIIVGWSWKKKTGQLKFGVGVGTLLGYKDLNIKNGFIKTDSTASNIHAQFNGNYYKTGNNSFNNGYGLVTEISWNFRKNDKNVRLDRIGIANLGVYTMAKVNHFSKSMDSAVHIGQTEINFGTLNNSKWITVQNDTVNKALKPDSTQGPKTILAPMHVFMDWQIKQWHFACNYLYMQGYLPSITISRQKAFTFKQIHIIPSLQLGGFDTYNINLRLGHTFSLSKKLNTEWMLQVNGLEAFAFPGKTHGAGAFVGIKVFGGK